MRMILAIVVSTGLAAAAAAMAQAPAQAPVPGGLQVGDPAPAFSLPGSDGAVHSLADLKGRQAVVLAWFPKAFTGG
jgi:thioredoxin-dependent peroxiredoxin